jgi:hypothetical protein
MKGGKRGLLVNSRDLCARPSFSFMNFKAQNGKQLKKKRLPLRVPACRGKGGKASRLIDAGRDWVLPGRGLPWDGSREPGKGPMQKESR